MSMTTVFHWLGETIGGKPLRHDKAVSLKGDCLLSCHLRRPLPLGFRHRSRLLFLTRRLGHPSCRNIIIESHPKQHRGDVVGSVSVYVALSKGVQGQNKCKVHNYVEIIVIL